MSATCWSWHLLIKAVVKGLCKFVCLKMSATVWCGCDDRGWVTGFQMSGLLLSGDDWSYHNNSIIIIRHYHVEFDISSYTLCTVWLYFHAVVCMSLCIPLSTTNKNETQLWIIPFRNKELVMWDAESLGAIRFSEACESVSCYLRTGRKHNMCHYQLPHWVKNTLLEYVLIFAAENHTIVNRLNQCSSYIHVMD